MYYMLLIYHNPKNNSYYYRKKLNLYTEYEIGYVNGYGHEIVLIIDLGPTEKIPFRRKIINRLIAFLQKRLK